MIDRFMRWLATVPWYLWVGACIATTMAVLFLVDLPTERAAWDFLHANGVSFWGYLEVFAFTWLRDSAFWGWIVIVGGGGAGIWVQARREAAKKPPS